ncbi:hypothetical protein MBLNU459_g0156t1 [Dothideomycetes sp. NU459]
MFKKKPTVKPLAPLRSSDRRRTADQIIAEYELNPVAQVDGDSEDKAAATAAQTTLRNALLPDNVQSARFTTTHGPDLKQLSGTVYVGTHPGDEQRVLWFKIEDKLYPTVYTLWRHPGILPLLHTPDFVVQKLQGGADLMTPGLVGCGPPFPEKAKKGSVVAVASLEKPSVPVSVGVCLIDVSALGNVQGARGHAVQTMHWAGDEIWAYSSSGKAGVPPPERIEGWLVDQEAEKQLTEQTSALDIEDETEDGGVALDNGKATSTANQPDTFAAAEEDNTASTKDGLVEQVDMKEMTTKDVDEAFRKAFLYGIHHHKETNNGQPHYGLQFPLSQSFVMSNLVQPFLPAFTPEQTNALQIKKSSFKNIKKFIKSLDKEKIVKTKERDGNETTIIDVNFEDRVFVDFKPYRLPKKETVAGVAQGRSGKDVTAGDTNDSAIGQKLEKAEFFKPKEKLLPIFASANASSSSLFTASEIKPIITAYIESEKLISPTNKRLVALNPTLANAVFDGSTYLDKEVLAKGTVPRDALVERIISSCGAHYAIIRNGTLNTTKPKAGTAPRIKLTLETRSGNKTVTKVSGVELYYISPQPLADELRKTCAGSTSVEQLMGSSPKTPVMEIMIQGPQKDAVLKALERRGVRSGWVEFLDKTKKKK